MLLGRYQKIGLSAEERGNLEDIHHLGRRRGLVDGLIQSGVLEGVDEDTIRAIIAEAGALGAVTISTNMAGRGTDIRLGGADEKDRDRVVALKMVVLY